MQKACNWLLGMLSVGMTFLPGAVGGEDPREATKNDLLTIGSSAPPIDAEFWFSGGANGQKDQAFAFEQGEVYVIEFWATWCAPCTEVLPAMMDVQERFQDEGVHFLYLSNEKREVVNTYLKRLSSADTRVKELAERFSVATDPAGSIYQAYVENAGLAGVPWVFVIGKTSEIEWVGHPLDLAEPLEAIVKGSWERESIGQDFFDRQEIGRITKQSRAALDAEQPDNAIKIVEQGLWASEKGSSLYVELMNLKCLALVHAAQVKLFREGNIEQFYKMLDATRKQHSDPELRAGFDQYELFVSVRLKNYKRLAAILDRRTNRFLPGADTILEICHAIETLASSDPSFPAELRKASIDAVQKALSALQNPKRQVVDVPLGAGTIEAQQLLARLYALDGQPGRAIEAQKKAMAMLREKVEESERKLNELRELP